MITSFTLFLRFSAAFTFSTSFVIVLSSEMYPKQHYADEKKVSQNIRSSTVKRLWPAEQLGLCSEVASCWSAASSTQSLRDSASASSSSRAGCDFWPRWRSRTRSVVWRILQKWRNVRTGKFCSWKSKGHLCFLRQQMGRSSAGDFCFAAKTHLFDQKPILRSDASATATFKKISLIQGML